MHASVQGGKVTQSFEEIYPEYSDDVAELDVDEKTAKLMDELAAKEFAELNRQWQQTNS